MQVKSDFVVHGASPDECAARIRQLLWPGNESSASDFVAVDALTINLATYQVNVAGEPLDLTYLEYALLAFLVTHPGRTYSRDALLRRVWASTTTAEAALWTSTSAASVPSSAPTSRSTWKRFEAWAIFGAPRAGG